jgi:apolipoprotein D and lipocalin family protein
MRMPLRSCVAAILVLAAGCAPAPSFRDQSVPIETVGSVDLARYGGLWYEIARYPNRFEKGCIGVMAEYGMREDGLLAVTNTCHRPGEKIEVAEGRARVVDGSRGAKLEVSFAPAWVPFAWGDYWILALDQDYTSALVGEPSGRYLWVLARTPTLPPARWSELMTEARRNGFDPSRLEITLQPPPEAE